MSDVAIESFVQRLRELGVRIGVDANSENLQLDAPKGVVTGEIAEQIRSRKAALLDYLSRPADRLPRRTDHGPAPLSHAQERLFFLMQMEPDSCAYNVPIAWQFAERADAGRLSKALDRVVARHEVLRTALRVAQDAPVQVIEPAVSLPFTVVELSTPADLDARLQQEARRPFDLAVAPLLRATLFQLADATSVLLVVFHHTVTDGASHAIFEAELQEAWRETDEIAAVPAQYADFAVWERQIEEQPEFAASLKYWHQHLAGELPVLDLPADRRRPMQADSAGATVRQAMPGHWHRALAAMAQEAGATPFMAGLAVYVSMLHKHTGQQQVVVGTPVSSRWHSDLQQSIGFFVNMLALRIEVHPGHSFRQLLQQVREVCIAAFAHQRVPFERILRDLQVDRDPGRTPVFQSIFAYENPEPDVPAGTENLSGLAIERRWPIHPGGSRTDVSLWLHPQQDGLQATLEYNAAVYSEHSAVGWLRSLSVLLESFLAHPDRPIGETSAIGEPERRRLLQRFNDTAVDYPRDVSLATLFDQVAAQHPEKVALRAADGLALSYRQLQCWSDRVAQRLLQAEVAPGSFVALQMPRSPGLIAAVLGCLKAGAAYLPIDSQYPQARRRWILENAQASLILVDTADAAADCADLPVQVVAARPAATDLQPVQVTDLPGHRQGGDAPAYMMYTSGSTGTPKGVVVPQRAVTRLVVGSEFAQLDETRVLLQLAPVSFDASTFEIWGALLNGATLCLAPGAGMPELETFAGMLREQEITTLWLTASLFNAIVDEDVQVLASVQEVLTGGEALSVSHVARAMRELPETQIINGYGPTENTTFTCCYRIPRDVTEQVSSIPIGRPIANTRVYIVDEQMQLVPTGAVGELLIGGDGLATGYHQATELSQQRFVSDPFDGKPGARLYRSGDYCRFLPDGRIEFVGRRDEQIKLRGFRIELGEIEAALLTIDGVEQAVVLCETESQAGARLLAFVVVASEGEAPDGEALLHRLRQDLPSHMLPSVIVPVDSMPLTDNGKVDRRVLLRQATTAAAVAQPAVTSRPPVSDLERKVLQIWREALNRPELGIEDDFFAHGGHSLLALRLLARLNRKFGSALLLGPMLQHRTAAACAALISGEVDQSSALRYVKSIRPEGSELPLFLVHGAYGNVVNFLELAAALPGDQPVYGIQSKVAAGDLDPHASVEEMAQDYLAELRTVQPSGPYRIGGFSAGGIIAHEMGRVLREAGESVTVMFLDTYPPIAREEQIGDRIKHHTTGLRKNPLRFVAGRIQRRIKTHTTDLRLTYGKLRGKMPLQLRQEHAFRSVVKASYDPQPSEAPTFLIRALGEVEQSGITARTRGWEQLAKGALQVIDVPGDHHSMFQQPNVEILSQRIGEILRGEVGG